MDDVERVLEDMNDRFPLVPHSGAGRLYSMVRRMKAEKEYGIPVDRRSGFAISVKDGKPANDLAEDEWEEYFSRLSTELQSKYPELYQKLFNE